jgi:hypothetical protein
MNQKLGKISNLLLAIAVGCLTIASSASAKPNKPPLVELAVSPIPETVVIPPAPEPPAAIKTNAQIPSTLPAPLKG